MNAGKNYKGTELISKWKIWRRKKLKERKIRHEETKKQETNLKFKV